MMNKNIVMCGCHTGGVKAIEGLLSAGYKFNWFVCLTPEQSKKYHISGYYDYRNIADKYNIPYYIPESYSLKSKKDANFFYQNKFDLLLQGGWQRLFPKDIIKSLKIGAIGLHGSSDKLPKGRGRSPMNWSLIEGKKRFLMHLFMIKTGVDDGGIIAIDDFDITPFDDIETLYFKYSLTYKKLLLKELPNLLNKKIDLIPQKGIPTYYLKRDPEDGLIDWEEMDVWQIYDFIRAHTKPYPGAFSNIKGVKIIIWRARVFDLRIRYDSHGYGEVVERFGKRILINCRGGLLLVDDWEAA